MFAMIRKWLRALIGWDEKNVVHAANLQIMQELDAKVTAMQREIQTLKHQREIREGKRVKVIDWEQLQADFAANPDNYKES